jgi:hypothetical protein
LGELGLLPSSDEGDVVCGAEQFSAADAAADFYMVVSCVRRYLRALQPFAVFRSHVLVEKTRNPVSRAAEKQEQSVLRETERTKGPLSESRMGRVFMLGGVAKL